MTETTDHTPSGRPLTGRKVLAIAVGAFAVVITANLTLAISATSSFPGLVVKNSYIAGVGWNARAEAARDLGWRTAVGYAEGRFMLEVTDMDNRRVGGVFSAVIGRPAEDAADRRITLTERNGYHDAAIELAPGVWIARLTREDEPNYRVTARFTVEAR